MNIMFQKEDHFKKSECSVLLDRKSHILHIYTIDYVLKGKVKWQLKHTYMFNYDDLNELPIKVKKFIYK